MRFRPGIIIAFLVGCVIASSGLALWSRIVHNTSAQRDTCQQVQNLSGVIQAVVLQDLQTLGKQGTGGYAYYQAHPAELASTRVSLRREAAQFAPKRCH